jgi:DNA invertase Pin-like site-specific DNA recombinase/DNA-directed RNA polymerase subunit RPC12/RpoP
MADVLRVLGSIRQSKTKRDRSVSPAAQRAAIQAWADERGYVVVKFTEDLSRSGKVSAFKRPELGPYFTDPLLIGTWDILVTTKIDRACRNTRDFLTIMDWCKDNGKTYVSLREHTDMTTAQGREYARQAASRAEWEREMASERRLETIEELREEGRWAGGKMSYGMRAQRDGGVYLVPDIGGTADIANKMADMAIAGKSNAAIQRRLNAEGIPNAAGKAWRVDGVRYVLNSTVIEQVLGEEKYAQLKRALRTRRPSKGRWVGGKHILLRVAFCMDCGSPLYGFKPESRPPEYGYYRCEHCAFRLRYHELETKTIDALMLGAGDELVHHKVVRMGDQWTAERYDLLRRIDTLREITGIDVSEPIAALEAKLREITDSIEPGTEAWEPTDQTVADYWATLDRAEQGKFLRDAKIRVEAKPSQFKFCITEAGIIQVAHSVSKDRSNGPRHHGRSAERKMR